VVGDQIQHAINIGGKYAETGLRWLGSFISGGVDKLGSLLTNQVEHTGQTNMSQTAESKWTELKQGTEKLFRVSSEYISVVLDPVMAKGKEVVGSISEKIDNSDNEKVKYLKGTYQIIQKSVAQLLKQSDMPSTGQSLQLPKLGQVLPRLQKTSGKKNTVMMLLSR
jgi:hypothetical protein